jgi:phosphoribosylamine--glycine ligase
MGAFSTDAILGAELERAILEKIVRPVIEGMRRDGCPFQGMLYTGLMLTAAGPKVLEFNVRMGDPEGQVILPRLESDFARLCEMICHRRLEEYRPEWSPDAAVCVVLASGGYPGPYARGKTISGIEMAEEDPRIKVFHAGTRSDEGRLITDGGRVLGVTAVGKNLACAIMSAYEAVNKIRFEGMHYRRDIGASGLQQPAHAP